ncbi:MAG: ABC transporter ATP-binding protein, partial [Candidatus Limnocylindrales bacterium]
MPVEKPKAFSSSMRRLLGELRPERPRITLVIALAVVSVACNVVGPRILGNATDLLFAGLLGKQLPAGLSLAQVDAGLRARGQGQLADMLSGSHAVPGVGVDFGAVGQVLLLLIAVYVLSALFSWASAYIMAGVAQRTVYQMRRQVDE